ncbi:tape measure protein [Clostridium botulinum]|nr:tape measure protein [Clostridium botulinum]
MSDGAIIIDTQIDSNGAERGIKGLGGKLRGIAKTGIKAFTGAITATSAALGVLGTIGVKYNSSMEQYMASFTTMLGSVDKASKHMEELKSFAAKTPFEMNDLAQASTTLLAFGVNVKDVMPDLKMLGDISLGNKEKFNGLALVFGQVKSQGKLMGQDLMQMINQGFNPLQVISEKTGKSMSQLKDEMSKGQITYEMVADAMKTATSAGGQFYNAMETQSKTLAGQWSTLKDNAKALAGEVFLPLTNSIKNNLLPTANAYIDQLSNSFKTKGIMGLVGAVGQIVSSMITQFASGLPKIVNLAVQVVQSLITGLQSNLPQISSSAMQIMQSLISGFITILPQIIQLGLQLIIQLGMGIAQAIPTLLPQIINVVIGISDMIIANVGTIINVGIQILIALVQGLVQALPTLIENVPRIINEFSGAIFAQLPTIILAGVKIILMLIKGLIQSIPTIIANLPQIIMAIFNALTLFNWASAGKTLITKVGSGIKGMTGNIGSIARSLAQGLNNIIKNIFTGGLNIGRSLITNLGSGIRSLAGSISGTARSIGSSVINAIKNIFSSAPSIGKNLIRGIWEGIKNMGSWIKGLIGDFASGIISGIKAKFKIHSPSRVMRDEVGKYIAQGIGVGFSDESENLQSSIDNDLSGLVSKMQMTVDHEVATTTAGVVASRNTTTNSTITNNNDNGLNITIEHFENKTDKDMPALMEEIEFYKKQNSLARGGI